MMFLYINEEFHLLLGKCLPGSTISIGREEKKAKIIEELNAAELKGCPGSSGFQGTEGAIKWNECLSPKLFALIHKMFFHDKVRNMLKVRKTSWQGWLFMKIAIAGNFFIGLKRIQLGEGHIGFCKDV